MPRIHDKDPYKILGIHPTADASQIKQAYHRLARQYHPDLNKDPRAAERMKDINWAYDILGDPEERLRYDLQHGYQSQQEHPAGTSFQHTHQSEARSSHSYTPPPSAGRTSYSQASHPKPPYEYAQTAQKPQAQGCSAFTLIWIVIIVLMNISRSLRSVPQTNFNYSAQNLATQTAQMERLNSAIDTLHALQEVGTDSPPLYEFFFTPTSVIPPISTGAAPTDEFGREDLRPKIVPGFPLWEWINQYFPELTTADGLSDEVTFVYWDQLRRLFIIETRQSGEYYISVSGGNLTVGRFSLESMTPKP